MAFAPCVRHCRNPARSPLAPLFSISHSLSLLHSHHISSRRTHPLARSFAPQTPVPPNWPADLTDPYHRPSPIPVARRSSLVAVAVAVLLWIPDLPRLLSYTLPVILEAVGSQQVSLLCYGRRTALLCSALLHSTPLHSTSLHSTPLYSALLHSTLLFTASSSSKKVEERLLRLTSSQAVQLVLNQIEGRRRSPPITLYPVVPPPPPPTQPY